MFSISVPSHRLARFSRQLLAAAGVSLKEADIKVSDVSLSWQMLARHDTPRLAGSRHYQRLTGASKTSAGVSLSWQSLAQVGA